MISWKGIGCDLFTVLFITIMSLLARAPLTLRQHAGRSRTVLSRSMHDYHHFPFQFPGEKKKAAFGLKVALFLTTGFSLPFAAALFQLKNPELFDKAYVFE
ncbi:hypothetical protein SERLADRAFT_460814 [Serpula lacrymans var. lacrymans S7.9]|uniref:Cytochrome c oxidase subunit 8, mitochondrial n=1 Tax=Serpula lacrymans var. lacrymans (strain S7.9) TaxID=578457 RepID=F8NMM6_SERL9|nr:uncharacterized protein SERLADRAFT_460814 [Serpula lacrymans var. lacrymans S7.9]EGO27423.1 hypothetical protein SERLADRAFT_460814 [Serpula lacrymans var. lacrymans S7.9]